MVKRSPQRHDRHDVVARSGGFMRVTFSAIPTFGHVFPLVPLASAMAAAGHEVTFAASSDFAGRLPGRVVQGVPEGLTLAMARREAASETRDRSDPFAFSRALFGSVMPRYMVPRLLDDWARTGLPDLVVHDGYNLCAAVAAGRAGVPTVAFHILLTPPDRFIRPLLSMADLCRPLSSTPRLRPGGTDTARMA
jgi:UDP:flavonoid glycosyltransferase YjiC (YdhE family)